MSVSSLDETDYGTDWAGATSAGTILGVTSGPENVLNALARRYQTPTGALGPYHPTYGLDLRTRVGSAMSPADVEGLRAVVKAQAEMDERIAHATADVSLSLSTAELVVNISGELVTGETFGLVMKASALTVEILNADGQALVTEAPSPTTTEIVYVAGPIGPPGPPGTSGGGGGGGGVGSFVIDDPGPWGSSLGTEEVAYESLVDFGLLGSSLTASFACFAGSASGTATVRLRVGGTSGANDGTIVGSQTVSIVGPLKISASGSLTNPTGLQWVKVSIQSSGTSVDSSLEGLSVSIR